MVYKTALYSGSFFLRCALNVTSNKCRSAIIDLYHSFKWFCYIIIDSNLPCWWEIEVTASFLLLPIIKPLICLFDVLLPNISYQCSRLPDLLINSLIFLIGISNYFPQELKKLLLKERKYESASFQPSCQK